ncbi:uncharacterized protein LOC141614415 [Silene latifolia]|uniref:uncharacterized protein LOC141614415 n=1 Tax=Silene latifolia TaxID=37657 RepID=UPI003D77C9CA
MGFKYMSEETRTEVAIYLLQKSNDGQLDRGAIKEAANRFNVSVRTISNIWRLAKKNQVGTVHSWVKEGLLKRHSSPLYPKLSELHKDQRLLYSLKSLVVKQVLEEFLDLNNVPVTEIIFNEMSNIIHMDEKWFYITEDNETVYVVEGEELSHRSCQSKRYITKVMFMCAVSRPIYGEDGECIFDGKIGMFPFTNQVPAARSSRNRPRGTLETKAIESITKQVINDCLIHQVIPAIKSVWPEGFSKHIYIQQDNARPHIKNDDPDFMAAENSDGFNIELGLGKTEGLEYIMTELGYNVEAIVDQLNGM